VTLKLKEVRESRFLTQYELAKKAGLGVATIARIEEGKTSPRLRTIRKIAEALGVEPGSLVD
jgi:transcriptional regulator with XRE-family HTH domain